METELLLTRDEMERRRLAAAQQLMNGASQASIARQFGVSRTTASRWHKAISHKGLECLRKRRATGRPSRLTPQQTADLIRLFEAGPREWGFESDRWTTGRLATAIQTRFGVHYDPDHVGRIMHRLGLREKMKPKRREEPVLSPVMGYVVSRYSPNTTFN